MVDEIRTKLFECGLVVYYSCSKIPCSRALVQKLIVAQLLKKIPRFTEFEGLIQSTPSLFMTDETSPHPQTRYHR